MTQTCQGPACKRTPTTQDLCDSHYKQRKRGKPLTRITKTSKWEGVSERKRSKYNKLSDLTGKWTRVRCKIDGCVKGAYAKDLCQAHYMQQYRGSQNSLSHTFPDVPNE